MDLLEQQLQREQEDLKRGLREQFKKNREDAGRCYFSNTTKGTKFRSQNLQKLRDALEKDHSSLSAGRFRSEKEKMIKTLMDVISLLKPKKSEEQEFKDEVKGDIFDIMAHCTLTAFIDDSMCPMFEFKKPDGTFRDPFYRIKKTTSELERFIGQEVLFQLKLYLISQVAEGYVKGVSKFASKQGLANRNYHHYNVNRLIDDFLSQAPLDLQKLEVSSPDAFTIKEKQRIRRNAKIANALLLFSEEPSPGNEFAGLPEDCEKFIGDWCRSVLMHPDTGINAFQRVNMTITKADGDTGKNTRRAKGVKITSQLDKTFRPVDEIYSQWKDPEVEQLDLDDLETRNNYLNLSKVRPMLVEPLPITDTHIGGWLQDYAKPLVEIKGSVDLSEAQLDFYNRQARVPFKLNTWTLKVLSVLMQEDNPHQKPIKLGSFKFHTIEQDDLPTVWDYIKTNPNYTRPSAFERMSKVEQKQDAIKQIGEDDWREAKGKVKEAKFQQQLLKRKGIPSGQTYQAAKRLADDERFYLPVRYDFRGRVIMRVPYINYQAADHGKALVKFADEKPIDSRTQHWLLIEMANSYGAKLDKEDFSTRKNAMLGKLDEIEAVARMVDDENDTWMDGFTILKKVKDQGGKCFQFAAACREFYEIYIAKEKKTTNLVVKVDCSTSSQQIAAVWLKDKSLALQTNVVANEHGKPMDLYGAVFKRMLENLQHYDFYDFTRDALYKLTELNFGRALVKAAFQGAAYGAGRQTQHEAIMEKMDELEEEGQLTLMEETPSGFSEKSLFLDLFDVALEEVCKLNILNSWFQDLAEIATHFGLNEIIVPTPIASKLFITYTPRKPRRIRTFGYGDTLAEDSKASKSEPVKKLTDAQKKERMGAWRTSNAPNVTHSQDACLIALALHDWEENFTSCHDSLGTYAGSVMDDMRGRLLESFTEIASFDIFNEILRANNLVGKFGLPAINQWKNFKEDILRGDLDNHYFTS